MILYIKDSKNLTRIHLEMVIFFWKIAVYRVNLQKSVAFLYTITKWGEKYITNTLLFTIALKNEISSHKSNQGGKIWTLNLEERDKEDIRKWKDTPCLWIGRIRVVKWPFYQKPFIDSMQSLSKYPPHSSQK